MGIKEVIKSLDWIREDIISRGVEINTPFGVRPLVYADYTASGQGLYSIENYIQYLLRFYANTHTGDDFTGKTTSSLLHQAEETIKNEVNAGDNGKIVFTGNGTTGAINKLLQILGIYISPATKHRLGSTLDNLDSFKPVVFIGPYEHHSNELMFRESFCEVVTIPLSDKGEFDLIALEEIVSNPKYLSRQKIGSFSAASNVTGIITPIYDVAKILHRHGAIACFDFAASGPYVEIDMHKDDESYFDAIYFSPHKFLGGPGSSGLLIFNDRIYNKELPPSVAAGGTVSCVTKASERYIDDIEEREKPGTPGILQSIKSALVFQLKKKIGLKKIEEIEEFFLEDFLTRYKDKIHIYGPIESVKRINIISFNIRHEDGFINPRLVTNLLNDLFGIQSRAGCSCAGPYGFILFGAKDVHIDMINKGYKAFKPGWVRINLHYTLSIEEYQYICKAIDFLIENAYLFISQYKLDLKSGDWTYIGGSKEEEIHLNVSDAFNKDYKSRPNINQNLSFDSALNRAKEIAQGLSKPEFIELEGDLKKASFFKISNLV